MQKFALWTAIAIVVLAYVALILGYGLLSALMFSAAVGAAGTMLLMEWPPSAGGITAGGITSGLSRGQPSTRPFQPAYLRPCPKKLYEDCRQSEIRMLEDKNRWYEKEIERLVNFKAYVHGRLDEMGVPADPESPHREHGCRVGGRLDWIQEKLRVSPKGKSGREALTLTSVRDAVLLTKLLREIADRIEQVGPSIHLDGFLSANVSYLTREEPYSKQTRYMGPPRLKLESNLLLDWSHIPAPACGLRTVPLGDDLYRWNGLPQRAPKRGEFYLLSDGPNEVAVVGRAGRDLKTPRWIMDVLDKP